MTKSLAYTPLSDPAGSTPAQWAKDIKVMKAKGWLQDPLDIIAAVAMPQEEAEVLLHKGSVCFSVCWRPKCKRAGRCCFMMPLAIRENRHRMWPDGVAESDTAVYDAPHMPASRLKALKIFSRRKNTARAAAMPGSL